MKFVIALGGNALGEQSYTDKVADEVVRQYKKGNKIVITHGNGPQVGELAEEQNRSLAVLTAETQAWIGTEIKNRLNEAFMRQHQDPKNIVEIVLTETLVNETKKDIEHPSKPIGRFYTAKDAVKARKQGLIVKKLIGGYRRVVPSPEPKGIVQIVSIKRLLKEGRIVIACGGGGVPVNRKNGKLTYVDAVIDKDKASALLAEELAANVLIVLTTVDGAYLNYKKKNQKFLEEVSAGQLKRYLSSGQFEEGSMKPKIESCIRFVESTGRDAKIGNLAHPEDVFSGKRCTLIMK